MRLVAEEAADAVLDEGGWMLVPEDGQTCGHGLGGCHVVAGFETRVGGVDVEAMALEDALELVPVARRLDGG